MKFYIFSLLLTFIFASVTLAVAADLRSVIISYADETPAHIIDEAKQAVKAAGGMITHEYKLIKAFAAKAPSKAIATVQSMGVQYQAVVEEDKLVHAQGGRF